MPSPRGPARLGARAPAGRPMGGPRSLHVHSMARSAGQAGSHTVHRFAGASRQHQRNGLPGAAALLPSVTHHYGIVVAVGRRSGADGAAGGAIDIRGSAVAQSEWYSSACFEQTAAGAEVGVLFDDPV
eukprot:scaffold4129_cov390-Prasinococcus_capsulatus_cf.AAC.11